MNRNIDTIFFDVGATLRYVVEDAEFSAAADRELMELVGATESHDVFFEKLNKNWKAYRKMAKTVLLDVSEMELWLQYLLPDYPAEVIAPNAARLTRLWRDHDGRRVPHDDVKPTLLELKRRGYKLGIIANTITESEITDWMIEEGISHCFTTTILSSKVRLRKPDPAIYHLACRCCGTPEAGCAYIGDNPDRDVEGTRAAGFGCMILIDDPKKGRTETMRAACDYLIENLSDLLDLFPARV